MGGKLIDFYTFIGDYDHVGIGEAPSEVAMTFQLDLGSAENVRMTTLKAFMKE